MAGVWETLFGSPPLQPVQGDPVNPAYSQMPNTTAPITDLRGAGPSTWASRPHDQNVQSRNMGGYNRNQVWGGPDYQWRQAHGYNNDLPTTPLADPDYYPDPSITANIRDAQARGQAAHDAEIAWATNPRRRNLPPGQQPQPSRPNQVMGPLSTGMWDGQ